jgi:hypothetical protein
LVSVAVYGIVDWVAKLKDGLGLLVSFSRTAFGIYIGGISIGYLTISLLVIFGLLAALSARTFDLRISKTAVLTAFLLALICGTLLSATQISTAQSFPNHLSTTNDGFTLSVDYGPTSFSAGNTISMNYQLNNDNYSMTSYYLNFGGQFSMVFYNSTGQQIKAFKVPISFQMNPGQTNIAFVPGQKWITVLSWNGEINSTGSLAPTGNYTLASYAVLQDANASMYVLLNTQNLTVEFHH